MSQCEELFKENESILAKIEDIITHYDKFTLPEIKKIVYESKLEVNGKCYTIDEVPKGTDLQINVFKKDSTDKFIIDDEWESTLDILLDSEFSDSLEDAFEESKSDSSYSHNKRVSNV